MKRGNVFTNKFIFSFFVAGLLIIFSHGIYAALSVNHSFDDIDFSSGVNSDFVLDGSISTNEICLNRSDPVSCKTSWEELSEVGICPPGLSVAYTYYTDLSEDSRLLKNSWNQWFAGIDAAVVNQDTCPGTNNWKSSTVSQDGKVYCMDHDLKDTCLDTIAGTCNFLCITRKFYQYTLTCNRKVKIECIQKDNGGNLPPLITPPIQ
jgi:hypothetical protein